MREHLLALAACLSLLPSAAAAQSPRPAADAAETASPPRHGTAMVAIAQTLAGPSLGLAAGFGTAFLYLAASGCGPFEAEPPPDDPDGYPRGDSWECLGPELLSLVFGVSGYLVGSSLGTWATGQAMGREGSYWATVLGTLAGGLAGAMLASENALPMFLFAQAGAVTAYHLTDRVRIRAAWERPAPGPRGPGAQALAMTLRPEVRVTVMRF